MTYLSILTPGGDSVAVLVLVVSIQELWLNTHQFFIFIDCLILSDTVRHIYCLHLTKWNMRKSECLYLHGKLICVVEREEKQHSRAIERNVKKKEKKRKEKRLAPVF